MKHIAMVGWMMLLTVLVASDGRASSVPSPKKSTVSTTATPGPDGTCCFDVVVRDTSGAPIAGSVVHIGFGACNITLCPTQPAGVVVSGKGVNMVTNASGVAHVCICATFSAACVAVVYADGVPLARRRFLGPCAPPDPLASSCPCEIQVSDDGTVCFCIVVANAGGPMPGTPVTVAFGPCTDTSTPTVSCKADSKGMACFCVCGVATPPCTATITAGGVVLCTVPVVNKTNRPTSPLFVDGLDGPAGTPLVDTTPEHGGEPWTHIEGTTDTIVFGPSGGVVDPGPNSRSTQCDDQSCLDTPFPMTSLRAYDVFHAQVVMANIDPNPASNPLESSRIDLVTHDPDDGTGRIFLGEVNSSGFWSASSGSGPNEIASKVTAAQPGDFLLDLYLDPHDVFADGTFKNAMLTVRPRTGKATAFNSGTYTGHIDALTCSTTVYCVDLVRNLDDEVRFDDLSLSISHGGPKEIFYVKWCIDCGSVGPPHLTNQIELASGTDIAGSLPQVGGQPWVQGGLQSDQFHVVDPGGVADVGPNSRSSNSWVTSPLEQPFDLSTLAANEGLHFHVTMANYAADPEANPLESSRVDLLMNTCGGALSLGQLDPTGEWSANSFADESIVSADPSTLGDPSELDLYLDPNDAAGDGPSPNAYLSVDGGTRIPGTFAGLSADSATSTVLSGIRLVRNIDDEVYFDDVLLEKTDLTGQGVTGVPPPPPKAARQVLVAPSPFRGSTEIRFNLAEAGDAAVAIYDVAGRKLRTLFSGHTGAGAHVMRWDGLNADGVRMLPGVYFVRVGSGQGSLGARVVLLN